MHEKSPNESNLFIGEGNFYEESSSDYGDEGPESDGTTSTEDFADFLWLENEEEFDEQELAKLEEQELMNECELINNQLELLDEIKVVALQFEEPICEDRDDIQKSNLNPNALPFMPKKSFT